MRWANGHIQIGLSRSQVRFEGLDVRVFIIRFGCGYAALGFIPTPRWGYRDA